MPDQYTVPQFIDVEDKILGPLSARQFIILLFGFLLDALLYKLIASLIWYLIVAIPIILVCGILALVKVNGVPFHYFLLNLAQTFRRPGLRVWDKSLTDAEVRALMKIETPPPTPVTPRKTRAAASRLQELTLVVNTGGVYNPEEE